MNILVICHYGLYSDLSLSFVHNQAKAYANLGHHVKAIVPIALGKVGADQRRFLPSTVKRVEDGVTIYYVRYLSLSSLGERGFNAKSAIASIQFQLNHILDGFIPDVIHAHTLGFDSRIGVWLKKRLGCPLVVTTHGSDTIIPIKQGRMDFLRNCSNQVDQIVAVSTGLANVLRRCGTNTPVDVILNGFNVRYVPFNRQKDSLSFIQAGSLIPRKKTDVTLRAFSQIVKRYDHATLKIVGSGPERTKLETLCHELGIDHAVEFLGQLPNQAVLEEMAKSQFFIMPSVREGFGIVYTEAMAAGCIAIGTQGEGIADLIVSGQNGILVPPDDPEAIVRSVVECLENPEKAALLAEQGRKDAMALTWDRNASCYTALFTSLVERKRESE